MDSDAFRGQLPVWVQEELSHFSQQLDDECTAVTSELLPCGRQFLHDLQFAVKQLLQEQTSYELACSRLDTLIELAYKEMSSSVQGNALVCWRRLYTDASIFRALAQVRYCSPPSQCESVARECVARLDRTIISAGPCGEGRLESILHFIARLQTDYLSLVAPSMPSPENIQNTDPQSIVTTPLSIFQTSSHSIPRLTPPPSFASFVSRHSRRPFILPGYVRDWPAMNQHPWASLAYLRSVAGPGRVVPVEVGSDYRSDDWTQEIMSWDDFLDALDTSDSVQNEVRPVLYLAQHSLFTQFPALREDISVPDYAYASLRPPAEYPGYAPPGNEDQLVLNAWLGPAGTVSPAHTDPFFNLYAQVVGRKTVWLAPPNCSPSMYPFPPANSPLSSEPQKPHNPAANTTNPSMSNTTRVDVFAEPPSGTADDNFPLFRQNVVPEAMCATLEPGDLLFFPPGWWHAMKSEDRSFSVSMWF